MLKAAQDQLFEVKKSLWDAPSVRRSVTWTLVGTSRESGGLEGLTSQTHKKWLDEGTKDG